MSNEHTPIEIDPQVFADFAGPDAISVIIVKNTNEHQNVIPKGTEYEISPIPPPPGKRNARSRQYYEKCVNGKLYCCCGQFCVRCGNC